MALPRISSTPDEFLPISTPVKVYTSDGGCGPRRPMTLCSAYGSTPDEL